MGVPLCSVDLQSSYNAIMTFFLDFCIPIWLLSDICLLSDSMNATMVIANVVYASGEAPTLVARHGSESRKHLP